MKRHKDLETLSFEHHDALVVALRIKKGLQAKADLNTIVDYVLSVFHNHLQHHFEQEEATLIAPLQTFTEAEQPVNQMIEEHQQFAELINKIQNKDGNRADLLKEIAGLLERHIRFEERTLFPLAERLIPKPKLAEIGEYLHQEHRPINKNWPDQFWKK